MKKQVKFRIDNSCEMIEVWVDDKCISGGNFWDLDYITDVPELLKVLGVKFTKENYNYDEEQ